MLPPTPHKKRRQLSPYLYLFIPVAFVLGLGAGYLLWSPKPATLAADTPGSQHVTVSTDGDPSIGPADAPITIVEFSDYQCPYCQAWYQQTFDQLMANYPGKIRLRLPRPAPAHAPRVAPGCRGGQLRRGTGRLLEIP